jgi:hypothetical protein
VSALDLEATGTPSGEAALEHDDVCSSGRAQITECGRRLVHAVGAVENHEGAVGQLALTVRERRQRNRLGARQPARPERLRRAHVDRDDGTALPGELPQRIDVDGGCRQTVNFYHRGDGQYREIDYPAAKQGEDELNRWVADTLARHPGLAGFYIVDERAADMVPIVYQQQRALAAAAPGTVTYGVLGDGWESQAPLWRDALDVMGLDPYPITKPSCQNHLAMVASGHALGRTR